MSFETLGPFRTTPQRLQTERSANRVRTALLTLFFVASSSAIATPTGQETATAPTALTTAEMENLLLNGRVTGRRTALKGVTDAVRVTLSDGRISHDAQVQNIDEHRAVFEAGPKFTEFNFRDSYRYNVAAYRLARLLDLDNVPMSVIRRVDGKPAAVTWWVDDVAMDEGGRLKLAPDLRWGPNPARTTGYIYVLRLFDELIQNRDRNKGNLLWTKDWTMWMIDHTRAFRTDKKLVHPEQLVRCERSLYSALRRLTHDTLTDAVGESLLQAEADAVLARRDLLVKRFEGMIAQRGEAATLFTLAR